MVGLPPTCSLQLYVDTNAAGQNALSIIQLDNHGNPDGGAMSFSNLLEGDAKNSLVGGANTVVTKPLGCMGNYLDFNECFTTKYYLLTGSYNEPERTVDNTWSQSDYKVQFQSDDILVIGWDDTRYIPPRVVETEDFKHDWDFNDIRAIIRLSDSDPFVPPQESTPDYSPAAISPAQFAPARASGYDFEVGSGEELVLIVASAASTETVVRVSQFPSRQTIWQQNTPASSETEDSEHTSHKVYVIRNNTASVQHFELDAEYAGPAAANEHGWQDWPYKVLASEEGTVTIGFKDKSGELSGADWPGVSVHARWFRN